MGKGDLWNALRGQVVETAKHSEVWKEMDKFESDKARKNKRQDEEKDEGRTRDPKTGVMMSGAQMRNARNAEGSVDWKDMFSNDERFSHVMDGAFSSKSKSDKVIDFDKMAAQAKAFAATRAKAQAGGQDVDDGAADAAAAAAAAAAASGEKRKRAKQGGNGSKKTAPSEERPPFALKPQDNVALLKKIVAVATMVAKNGLKFEQVTRKKQEGNEKEFSFLFGGDGEDYYRWLTYAIKAGISPDAPPGATPGFNPLALAEAARKIAEAAAAAVAPVVVAAAGVAAVEHAPVAVRAGVPVAPAPPPSVAQVGAWQAVKDATGRTYFWNKASNTTTWDPPPGF
mmetsp:Transcript_24097/g.59781  ORF Transcript_24097/g.59781 Transcript_24097/m.59781 type:complete len:341 (-) Transcript_24097:85-1107(-)|eukprot:CAMPEP_0181370522 /NCGR_PEP_ID=MMETSP1106-20121128/13474_1 /TAXON_ID=81844 /ORGANISM="Mantoniella antarctica, Strain SL-175" /LENGTH=340 /DNA_ID=CAMNT_0023487327 /DNA_START=37 /DNA_END=1059 /DNA_ORIENTATION=+